MPADSFIPTPACQKRLLQELRAIQSLSQRQPSSLTSSNIDNDDDDSTDLHTLVLPSPSLGPVSESSLLHWRTILLGPAETPYEHGRWELAITIPPTYPLQPPRIRFVTPCCHPNIALATGEICLDLLKSDAGWTPAYTIVKTLEAIQMLLRYPAVDSPLNVDIAVLIKEGDALGAEGVIRWWCREKRWDG